MNGDDQPNLGQRLKELRREKNLSLNDLARLTGLSRSTLYKVENSGMSLTYQKLLRLSEGLGVEISQLFRTGRAADQGAPAAFREVGRPGEGDLISTPNYDHYYLCNEIVHKGLVPMMGRVKQRTIQQFGELSTHSGEEFTYVLEGTVEVHTQLYRPVTLGQGDYIYLSSTMPHAYISKGPQEAKILTVCTRPEHIISETAAEAPPAVSARSDAVRRRERPAPKVRASAAPAARRRRS